MTISEISIAEFTTIYNRGINLVDVREADEYESGHVAGAVNIPLSEFASRVDEIPSGVTYMICRSGGRSMQACEYCVDIGKGDVVNIAGGTLGWVSAGNEVVLGGNPE
ncbi:MAG: rhodanese-like domain-containing protein [Acidimicrobiia bacterium]|nr:rhodanese-like domain-containing protein [Acidimicrobiia bacterium]